VRNGADTLAEALDSLTAQTDPDFEVVVVDDGSTDRSAEVAQTRARADPRIRVCHRPARGLVAALNHGLTECRGRFVARMDADDRAHPRRLERQIPLLEEDDRLAVVDGQVRFFRDAGSVPGGMQRYQHWVNQVIEPEDFDRLLLVESPVVHPAATLRREVVVGLGGYREGPFPEDYDLWVRLHAAGWRFRKVPEALVEMRDRPRRLTRTDARYGKDGFRRVRQMWLAQTALAEHREVLLWATRKESRPWLRWLLASGHTVVALVDIDPKKIGATRRDVPVVSPEALPKLEAEIALVAVGGTGARAQCRATLQDLRPDWREGRDWWAVL
jgi:GT2 family glycosyltransferase